MEDFPKAGDVVWAKMKGFPAWPGVVFSGDNMPLALRDKKCPGSCVPVVFFGPRKDCSFINISSLKPFKEFKSKYEKGYKSKEFKNAVKEAAENPESLIEFDYDELEREIERVKQEEKTRKKDQKSSPKKRKSQAEETRSSKRTKSSEDDQDVKRAKTPYEILLGLRYRLQKIFLTQEGPRKEDFYRVDNLMKNLENFNVTFDLLKQTKVGKVIKKIAQLKLEEEPAKVVDRSSALLDKWRKMVASDSLGRSSSGSIDSIQET